MRTEQELLAAARRGEEVTLAEKVALCVSKGFRDLFSIGLLCRCRESVIVHCVEGAPDLVLQDGLIYLRLP